MSRCIESKSGVSIVVSNGPCRHAGREECVQFIQVEALRVDFRVPPYLYRVLQDYLTNCWLMFDTPEGMKKMQIASETTQGSVLGVDLWNLNYDGILRTEMPEGCLQIGYADDLVAVITARTTDLLQLRLNQVMRVMRRVML